MFPENLRYKKYKIDSKLQYFKPNSSIIQKSFAEEIADSLTMSPKSISEKFFYDNNGSHLFEKISQTPEYYLTRTELKILDNLRTEIIPYLVDSYRLVELGSGSSKKTRLILNILSKIQSKMEYIPIDVSEILTESSELLQKEYPELEITGIIDTYEGGLEFLKKFDSKKNLIGFFGSSFGNFSPVEGKSFLKKINSSMKKGDLFLIGTDLVKKKSIIEKAYNDNEGITSQFNLNVLSRINDELDANFILKNFIHYAIYNDKLHRVEMYLKSLTDQHVDILGSSISINLKKDELILTEYSFKYTISQIQNLMNDTGYTILRTWQDEKNYFSLTLAAKV